MIWRVRHDDKTAIHRNAATLRAPTTPIFIDMRPAPEACHCLMADGSASTAIACRSLATASQNDRRANPMTCAFMIRQQTPADTPAIDALHEEAFGPGRFARTAYRIREASTQPPPIALTAWHNGELAGAIHFTAIKIGERRGAILLGPLAIAPAYKNKGCGLKLMKDGLGEAAALGFRLAILVGDLPYYQRVGFGIAPPGRIVLPGPVDRARLLAAELAPGALAEFSGPVTADNDDIKR